MLCLKCGGEEALIICNKCEGGVCLPCSKTHLMEQTHLTECFYVCQECEEEKASKYCFSCDQNLCTNCNARIHNKGKRGQHKIQEIIGFQKFLVKFLVVVPQDATPNPEQLQDFFGVMRQKLSSSSKKQDLKKQNIHLLWQNASILPKNLNFGIVSIQTLTDQYLKQYSKYFPLLQKIVVINSHSCKQLLLKLTIQIQNIHIIGEQQSKSNISFIQQQSRNDVSISTENESILKGRKPTIAYFQFYKLAKDHRKSETEIFMRKLAAEGQLLVKSKQVEAVDGVIRTFIRTVGDLDIEYCSLDISYLSVESLIWVIRSIKMDRMTPGEKLILSRIKECFDIKINSKLWTNILAYLTSKKYQQDYCRMNSTYGFPRIVLGKSNDENLLLLQNEDWPFQDQQKPNEQEQCWGDFIKFLLDYFDNNKTIPGGRYGCVQFVKMFGPRSLEDCSLGKLSMFVQEAINKGIIRYHKTLLIKNVVEEHQSFTNESSSILQCNYSFQLNDKQLYLLQKEIKIKSLQVGLINMLCNQATESTTLAQIPYNLKNYVGFDFDHANLGFPKLKNFILTLSDILRLQIVKANLNFGFHSTSQIMIMQQKQKLQLLLSDYFRMILEILHRIIREVNVIVVNDFYCQLNQKLGFEFEYRLYQVNDFYHFLCYYCPQIVKIHIVNGSILVYSLQQPLPCRVKQNNPQISTPDFCNSFEARTQTFKCKLPDSFINFEDDRKDEEDGQADDVAEGISDIQPQQFYSIMDEDGQKSQSTLKTFIQKPNVINNLEFSLLDLKQEDTNKTNTKNHNKTVSQDFLVGKKNTNHGRSTSYVQAYIKTSEEYYDYS